MLIFIAACFLPSLLVAALTTAAMRKISPMVGLIDRPAARKVHRTPTPLGGGVGIVLGVILPMGLAHLAVWLMVRNPSWQPEGFAQLGVNWQGALAESPKLWAILAGGVVLSVMGLWDDLRNLPWLPRLAVQFLVAAGLVAFGVRGTVFVPLPWIGYALTVLWIMVLVNSFNFLDNMDGLSSGIALAASLLFAAVMLTLPGEPRWLVGGMMLVLAGALAGLLLHNWSPARIFMGDSGSYFIGLLMACLTVVGTFYQEDLGSRHVILAPLCILAVPLYDFCSVVLIRLSQKRSPFQPDKSHFSHRLVELGLKPRNAVLTIHLATLTTGLGALLLYRVADWSAAETTTRNEQVQAETRRSKPVAVAALGRGGPGIGAFQRAQSVRGGAVARAVARADRTRRGRPDVVDHPALAGCGADLDLGPLS